MCETTMHVGWVSVRWNILYTDRDRIRLQFTMWILPLCCRHNVKQSWLKKLRRQNKSTVHLVRLKKKVKAKINALQRLTMDCFHFLNDDKNWNVFRYDICHWLFNPCPPSNFILILVFQQRQHEHYADNGSKNTPFKQSVWQCGCQAENN